MTLYDALKASKGLPVSDSYTALWGKSAAESGIKTLTGRLPLFFRTSESKLRDWTIYGNNDVGKNLLEITTGNQVHNGVSFIVDKAAGTVTATRVNTAESDSIFAIDIPDSLKGQELYFSGCPTGGSVSTYDIYALDHTTASRAPQWNGTTSSATDYGQSNNHEVKFVEGHRSQIRLRVKAGYDAQNVVFKPMLRPANTTSTFEPYTVGVGERTKNYANVETEATVAGVTFTVDPDAGTVTANGTATGRDANFAVLFNSPGLPNNSTVPPGNYYFSGCPNGGGNSSYNCYLWDNDTGARSKQWDGTTDVDTDLGQGNCQVQINGHQQNITLRIRNGYIANNVVFKPMLRAADTTPDFIPFGYEIPLVVSQQGQPDKTYDIYIGDSPLTEGETVSKTSTGVDLELFEGENTVSTTLYNKPEMKIKYKE